METRCVVDENGKRVSIILPIEELEELEDIRAADEARSEIESGEDEFVPWEQARKVIVEERARAKRGGLV